MVQELEQEFKGSVIDVELQEFTDANGNCRIFGSPAGPIRRNIFSSQKVGLQIIAL